jgi:signal transduction histidine kinase
VADSLEEARALLVQGPWPDLIIADLNLPDGRGIELLTVKGGRPTFPLVVLTGQGDERAAVEAMKAGALDYVVKSSATLFDMPHIAERALREWGHITERIRARDKVRQRNRELAALNEIGQAITSTLDLEETLTLITDHTTRLLGVQATALLLHDEANDDLWFAAGSGVDVNSMRDKRLALGQGIAGWVVQHGVPALVPDVSQDPRFFDGFDQADTFTARSVLCVPLQSKEHTIGALEAINKNDGPFNQEDLHLLSALAAPAATAIENAGLFEATQQQLQGLCVLHAVAVATTRLSSEDELIEHATEVINAMLYPSSFGVALLDEATAVLRPHPASRPYRQWTPEFDLLQHGIVAQVVTDGQPRRISDVTRESEYLEIDPRTRSELCVPLKVGERVIGVINLESTQPDAYTEADERLLMTIAGQLATAIERVRLFQAEQTSRRQLRALSRRLVEVQEAERGRVSRELHDEAGQTLSSLLLGLSLLAREADQPAAVIARAAELEAMVDKMLSNLHRLAMNLRPASLDHLGLVAALEQYVEAFSQQHGLAVQFETVGLGNDRLPQAVATTLYRVVQEALTNVTRHAQATRVDVLLERSADKLVTIVEDDGVGFAPTAALQSGRLGLFGMRERAEVLGGTLTIESTVGAGTTILIEIPYADSDSHR